MREIIDPMIDKLIEPALHRHEKVSSNTIIIDNLNSRFLTVLTVLTAAGSLFKLYLISSVK